MATDEASSCFVILWKNTLVSYLSLSRAWEIAYRDRIIITLFFKIQKHTYFSCEIAALYNCYVTAPPH